MAVALLEAFFDDDAILIEEEGAGVRNATAEIGDRYAIDDLLFGYVLVE